MTEPSLVDLQVKRTAPPKRAYRRGRPVCRYCGSDLTAIARGRGACDSPDCRKKDRRLRDTLRRERDEIEMAAMRVAVARAVEQKQFYIERLRSDAEREIAEGDSAAPALEAEDIAATCHTSTPLVPLPRDVIDNFRERLLRMFGDIFEHQDEERAKGVEPSLDDGDVWVADLLFRDADGRQDLERPAHPAEIAVCAACRGRCCESGNQNLAYFRPADIARFRQRNPGATPESMADAFLAHLPDTYVQHSCPFHGEFGCTIPREMRNNICNGYKCFWLKNVEEMVKAGEPPRVVAGFHEHRPQRAFAVGDDGTLTELSIDTSISSADMLAEAADAAKAQASPRSEGA